MTSVAVVGLGKIGLPLAALYANKGCQVVGVDINPAVVDAVNAGRGYVGGEPGLTEAVRSAVGSGRLSATTEAAGAVARSDIVVVMVRVGLDDEMNPDFHHLDSAAAAIGGGLSPGSLIILESTVPVGITRNHFGRKLAEASDLSPDDFHLAYSPERVSSGSIFRDLSSYPKLVGGVDDVSGEAAAAFYRGVLDADVMLLPDAETAEFAKLAESIYRDVNIALANELAVAAEKLGVSYAQAARAGNSQPYSHLHTPGLGVGGHCIPVYPYFLTAAAYAPLTSASREVNDGMAAHGVELLGRALGGLQGKTVLVLGLAYRGGVKESERSSALLVIEALRAQGATALLHDPLYSHVELEALGFVPTALPPRSTIDAVVLQSMHDEYRELDFAAFAGCRVVLDGRGALDRQTIEAAGLRYIAIGEPDSRRPR